MEERHAQLLAQIIEIFIKSSEPVSSKSIEKSGFFSLSSATIRNEMNDLEEAGYLVQLHISGGRVPTAKAYRFYVDNFVIGSDVALDLDESRRIKRAILAGENDPIEISRLVAKTLANLSGQLVITNVLGRQDFYKTGLSQLLNFPEFREFDRLIGLTNFFDQFESIFEEFDRRYLAASDNPINVLIGPENRLGQTKDESIITTKYDLPEGFTGSLTLIGPMRMNYRRNICLIKHFADQLNINTL